MPSGTHIHPSLRESRHVPASQLQSTLMQRLWIETSPLCAGSYFWSGVKVGIKWEKRSKISKQKKKEENNLWCWGVYSLTENTQAQYCRTTKKNTSQDKWTQYRVSVSKEKTIFLVKVRLDKDKSVLKIIPPNLAFFEGCNKSLGNEISFVLFSCRDTPASSGLGGPTLLQVPYTS